MPKRVITFKPTAECEVQMAALMDRWNCDRTAALIRAVAIAHGKGGRSGMVTVDPPRLSPGGLTRGAAVELSEGRPDPLKIAAAQKRFGMGGVKK